MSMIVAGKAKVIDIYNITRLEMEGVDLEDYDLASQEDVRELFERVNDFIESGEADAIEPPVVIEGVDPEECSITVGEKRYYPDEMNLRNIKIEELLASIQEANIGDLYYIRSMEGDGQWVLEGENEESKNISLGYADCSLYFDQYDVLKEGYLDLICDTIVPREIRADDEPMEVSEFIFDPVQVWGQLYKVVEDPESGVKVLQKVDFGGRMLAGTDYIVDDFEEN